MPTVRANGVSLYYETSGDGPPLLFVSGLGRNALGWSLVTPSFVERHRCIVFDNRGTGRSEVPPGPYTIDAMADDAAALLAALGIETADAIGLSLGASVVQALAYRHPGRLRRMALVSALPRYTDVQQRWLDAWLALRRSGAEPMTLFVNSMPWLFTPRLLANHAEALRYASLSMNDPYPTSLEGFEAQAAAIRVFDSGPWLPTLDVKTLVLTGAEDVLTPVHQAIEIASLIPGAELRILPRGGHAMIAEYQDDVVRVLKRFLAA